MVERIDEILRRGQTLLCLGAGLFLLTISLRTIPGLIHTYLGIVRSPVSIVGADGYATMALLSALGMAVAACLLFAAIVYILARELEGKKWRS